MTSTARLKSLLITAVAFGSLHFLILRVAAETAECADPPGGSITCESRQVASCAVKNGKVNGHCKTPPANMKATDLKAFVLSDLKGESVSATDVNSKENKDILSQGTLTTSDGKIVNFKIPKELMKSPETERAK